MSFGILFKGGGGNGKRTAAAGTRIQYLIGGVGTLFTHLLNLRVVTGATAHVMTAMRGASRSTAAADLAAAGTALIVADPLFDGQGGAIAINDLVCVELDNGDWHLSVVSAWNAGTLTITLTTAVPTGRSIRRGARVTNFGVPGDAFHSTYQFDLAASSTNQIPSVAGAVVSVVRASASGEPLLIDIDNATNASVVAMTNWGFAQS